VRVANCNTADCQLPTALLIRSGQSDDDSIESLRTRAAQLQGVLTQRAAEITRAKADLAAFRIRYTQDVGLLHEELDELERAIAEAELGEIAKSLADTKDDSTAPSGGAETEPAPRFTSDAVRKLFRDVAKTIHPDLAHDADTRDRRHLLMVEANRAYEMGDEERLRWVLEAWERSPEAVRGSDEEAIRLRLVRRIAEIEQQLEAYAGDLAAMQDSPLWKLKAMVDEGAARGKDLVADMVRRLRRDIMAARNRLDAMLWHP
jgi:hypothetical protein